MVKGFGVNSKAQEARERKEAQKEVKKLEEQKKKEEREEKEWKVGVKTKSTKQIQEEQRRNEKAQQKLERERLEALEEAELSKYKTLKPLTREKLKTKMENLSPTTTSTPSLLLATTTNPNFSTSSLGSSGGGDGSSRSINNNLTKGENSITSPNNTTKLNWSSSSIITAEEGEDKNSEGRGIVVTTPTFSASNIDDALFLLDPSSSTSLNKSGILERHPERRMKASYATFEERELGRLREEFPGLRLSQLREKLQKIWQKSPENPLNQPHIAFNATKSQETLKVAKEIETNLERLKL